MQTTRETKAIFAEALENFKQSLTADQRKAFAVVSVADVEAEAKNIEKKHSESRTAQNMSRIRPFINAVLSYSDVLNIFTQSSDLMVFIWGPICFLLKAVSKWFEALDKLLDALENLGEKLAIFNKYSDLFKKKLTNTTDPHNLDLRLMLGRVYEDILNILALAMKIFPRNVIRQMGTVLWPRFEKRVDDVLSKFDKDKALLESALLAENSAEARKWQKDLDEKLSEEFRQVRKWQKQLDEKFDRQEKHDKLVVIEAIRQALHPAATSTKIEDAREILQKRGDTGGWLLRSEKVKAWFKVGQDPKVIALTGNPGVGKSILSSIIAETLRSIYPISNYQVLSAFLSYQEGQNHTCIDTLSSLLYQAVVADWQFYDIIMEKYGPDLHALSTSKIKLRDALIDIASCGPTFFILDGFDEIGKEERRELTKALHYIYNSSAKDNVKMFLSSRPEADFLRDISRMNPAPVSISVTTESTKDDLESYVVASENMDFLKSVHRFQDQAARKLLQAVASKSDGMFLYAKLVLLELDLQTCPDEVEEAIENLPRGLEAAYERVFERMKVPCTRNTRAVRVLHLLLKGKRKLRVAEVTQAIMMDDIFDVYYSRSTLSMSIEELCGSLIETRGGYVTFVHFSVHEYLLKQDKVFEMEEDAIHESIATLCLRQLSLGSVRSGESLGYLNDFVKRGEYAFVSYSYDNWLYHVKESQSHGGRLAASLRPLLRSFCDFRFSKFLQGLDSQDPVQACLLATERYLEGRKTEVHTTTEDPTDLTGFVSAINNCLKSLALDSPGKTLQELEFWYGGLYRCSRQDCGSFTVGFDNREMLENHEDRHSRPFTCEQPGCHRNLVGFSTEQELVSHRKTHQAISSLPFHDTNTLPGQIEAKDELMDPAVLNVLIMDLILAQDREAVAILERLMSSNYDFSKLSLGQTSPLNRKQMIKWMKQTSLSPSFLLDAAVQSEDEVICRRFLNIVMDWERTINDAAFKVKTNTLLYFAASKGLARNIELILKECPDCDPLSSYTIFSKSVYYQCVLSPLLFAIYSGNEEAIATLRRRGINIDSGLLDTAGQLQVTGGLYTALRVCHGPAVKTILDLIQSYRGQSALSQYGSYAYQALAHSDQGPEAVREMIRLLTNAGLPPSAFVSSDGILACAREIVSLDVLDIFLEYESPSQLKEDDASELFDVLRYSDKRCAAVALHLLEAGWDNCLINHQDADPLSLGSRPCALNFQKYVGKTWEQALWDTADAREKRRETRRKRQLLAQANEEQGPEAVPQQVPSPPAPPEPPTQSQPPQHTEGDILEISSPWRYNLKDLHANADRIPPHQKKEGPDWFVHFNPHVQRVLNVDLVHTFEHSSVVSCVKFSSGGRYVATGCNRITQIFDVTTGRRLCELQDQSLDAEVDNYIRCVCFSPDGCYLVTGCEDSKIRVWDISAGAIKNTLVGHKSNVYTLDVSSSGDYIVSGGDDLSVRLWDMRSGAQILTLFADHGISSAVISPDEKYLAAGCLDKDVWVWDATTGSLLERFLGHSDSIYSVAFTPDGRGLISGSLDRTIKVWDLFTHLRSAAALSRGDGCVKTFEGHEDFVLSVAVTPDGQWIMSGSKDRSVQFWDSRTGNSHLALLGHQNSVISVASDPAGGLFATASGDCRARIWSYEPYHPRSEHI